MILLYLSSELCWFKYSNKEEGYDEYYLKSLSFDATTDDGEISSEAIDIVALINGETQLEVAIVLVVYWLNWETRPCQDLARHVEMGSLYSGNLPEQLCLLQK